jgi:hypothetical protein
MPKPVSNRFSTCRKLVHDDAFEGQLAVHMVTPLLSKALRELKPEYHSCGIFLRRALIRYLGIVLYRLLDKPQRGRTGETASISSLLEMAKSERVLDNNQIKRFTSEFDKIVATRLLS